MKLTSPVETRLAFMGKRADSIASCEETVVSVIHGNDKRSNRLCLFSTYDPHSVVDPYVTFHLEAIVKAGFDVVLISTSPKLRRADISILRRKCRLLIHRQNVGLDFASWKAGISVTSNCAGYDRLLLVNDSVFGPFVDLTHAFDTFESSEAGFCGMTESFEQQRHLQSYFLYFKLDSIPANVWQAFWASVSPLLDKGKIVELYEIGLTQHLIAAGVDLLPYVKSEEINAAARSLGAEFQYAGRLDKDAFNSTWFMWDLLLMRFEFPYLKRVILECDPLAAQSLGRWRELVCEDARNTLVPLIDAYLKRLKRSPPRTLRARLAHWHSKLVKRVYSS